MSYGQRDEKDYLGNDAILCRHAGFWANPFMGLSPEAKNALLWKMGYNPPVPFSRLLRDAASVGRISQITLQMLI